MIWGQGLMCGEDVLANQKHPMGRSAPPTIMGISLSSGSSFPFFLKLAVIVVKVT